MEYTREFKVTIYTDTNKRTIEEECDTAMQAVQALLPLMTAEERMEVFSDYCRGCGTDELPCHCQNDD